MAKERDTKLRQTTWAVGCPALIMSRRIPTMINYIWKTLPGLVSGRRHLLTEHNGLIFFCNFSLIFKKAQIHAKYIPAIYQRLQKFV